MVSDFVPDFGSDLSSTELSDLESNSSTSLLPSNKFPWTWEVLGAAGGGSEVDTVPPLISGASSSWDILDVLELLELEESESDPEVSDSQAAYRLALTLDHFLDPFPRPSSELTLSGADSTACSALLASSVL